MISSAAAAGDDQRRIVSHQSPVAPYLGPSPCCQPNFICFRDRTRTLTTTQNRSNRWDATVRGWVHISGKLVASLRWVRVCVGVCRCTANTDFGGPRGLGAIAQSHTCVRKTALADDDISPTVRPLRERSLCARVSALALAKRKQIPTQKHVVSALTAHGCWGRGGATLGRW